MTSEKDRPLRQAPIVHRAESQAVKRARGSRHPSRQGARRPSCGLADPRRPRAACFDWAHAARRTKARHGRASVVIYRASGAHAKERRGSTVSEISLYLLTSLLLIKREGRPLAKGTDSNTCIHVPTLHRTLP
jgi:hypothetical protein